tara:strand:- start:1081 stop:1200 length:120 start_codon:yes stop_codon:yes gene_type:complete
MSGFGVCIGHANLDSQLVPLAVALALNRPTYLYPYDGAI